MSAIWIFCSSRIRNSSSITSSSSNRNINSISTSFSFISNKRTTLLWTTHTMKHSYRQENTISSYWYSSGKPMGNNIASVKPAMLFGIAKYQEYVETISTDLHEYSHEGWWRKCHLRLTDKDTSHYQYHCTMYMQWTDIVRNPTWSPPRLLTTIGIRSSAGILFNH